MKRRGFTLLEVLVATAIMAIAVTTALSALRTSLRNADRQTETARAASLARRKMGELLAQTLAPCCQVSEGVFPPAYTGGVAAGWSALITPSEAEGIRPAPGMAGIERVQLEVWWQSAAGRRTMKLEAYRRARLTLAEADWMVSHAAAAGGGTP
jgi:general secretion pathway protein I